MKTPEEYRELKKLFSAACDLAPRERERFLKKACAGKPTLREELDALFDSDDELRGIRRKGSTTFEERQIGNRSAFDRFFERHAARVLVYINYNMGPRLRHKLEPTDILQTLHRKLLKNFESSQKRAEQGDLHKTLIQMADHDITEAYRRDCKLDERAAKRELVAAFADETGAQEWRPMDWVPSSTSAVGQRVAQHKEYQRMMRMLSELSLSEQYITVARVIEGLSTQDIAERLGSPREAVQKSILRARDKLRKRAALDRGDS